MEDYLSEKEQWERVVAWIRQEGPWFLAAAAVAAVGFAGWQWWRQHQDGLAVQAGARYQQVIDAYTRGDLAIGERLTDQLVQDFSGSAYADQAELASARIEVEKQDSIKAATRLQHVLDRGHDPQLGLLVRLRLARVQLDEGKPDDALKTLNAVDAGAFAPRYAEVRGDALLAKGDRAGALREYRTARAGGADVIDADLLDLKINELAHS